jgi:hypothetical protein
MFPENYRQISVLGVKYLPHKLGISFLTGVLKKLFGSHKLSKVNIRQGSKNSVLVLLDPVDEGTTILEMSLNFTSQHGVMS